MKTLATATLTVFAIASAAALSAAPASAPRPDYSIAGIVQPAKTGDAKSAAADLAAAIGAAQLLYTGDGSALRAILATRNRLKLSTPVIVYMGGITTNPTTDLADLEKNYRSAIAMTPAAELTGDIDATTTRIGIGAEMHIDEFSVKASTSEFSSAKDSAKYCFWLRVDDEMMRVTAVKFEIGGGSSLAQDAQGHVGYAVGLAMLTVTVERGFAGTTAAAHKAHARVLTPVYLGSRDQLGAARHSNSWPGGPDGLRYALDPRQPAAQKFKADIVAGVMREGYDGAWFDTFQPKPYNFCDALGRHITFFWDFKTGAPYTPATYLDALKDYIRGVRVGVRAATGREPVLFANSATSTYKDGGAKELFNHGDTRDLLDGYCFEDSYLRVQATRDKKSHGAAQAAFHPITGDKWLDRVTIHADAASSGLCGICMAGTAGYLAQYINGTQPNYAQLLRYAYASFLLTVTKERTTMLGWPMHASGKNTGNLGIVPWPSVFFAGLGDPLQENKIAALKIAGSPCYMRHFQNGLVIINPSDEGKPPAIVSVPAGYIDAMTGQPVPSQLTLPPADAAILVRSR